MRLSTSCAVVYQQSTKSVLLIVGSLSFEITITRVVKALSRSRNQPHGLWQKLMQYHARVTLLAYASDQRSTAPLRQKDLLAVGLRVLSFQLVFGALG